MMTETTHRKNDLGVTGWAWAGRYKIERYLYILHSVTGLGLILFAMMHLTATTIFRVQAQHLWTATMGLLHNPWFKAGEFLVVAAFSIHALNGLRLIFQELGFLLGKPVPPIYPYKDSIRKKRPLTIVMLVLIILVIGVFFYDFNVGGW